MTSAGGFDGHVHTFDASMESLPVDDIVRLSVDAGLDAIAITDHNKRGPFERAVEVAAGRLEIVPGIELDSMYGDKKAHIICYFPDCKSPGFARDLERLSRGRKRRMPDIVGNFAGLGLIPRAELGDVIGDIFRMGIYTLNAVAYALIDRYKDTGTNMGMELDRLDSIRDYMTPDGRMKGHVDLLSKLIHEYIGKGGPCYVPYTADRFPDYREVVDFCTRYRAPCGFAHIYADLRDQDLVEKAFADGADAGMTVVGTGHPRHRREEQEHLLWLAGRTRASFRGRDVAMMPVDGSDYHAIPGMPPLGGIRSPASTLYALKELAR